MLKTEFHLAVCGMRSDVIRLMQIVLMWVLNSKGVTIRWGSALQEAPYYLDSSQSKEERLLRYVLIQLNHCLIVSMFNDAYYCNNGLIYTKYSTMYLYNRKIIKFVIQNSIDFSAFVATATIVYGSFDKSLYGNALHRFQYIRQS